MKIDEEKNKAEYVLMADAIADVLWWIKGYKAATEDSERLCGLEEFHLNALREAKRIIEHKADEIK